MRHTLLTWIFLFGICATFVARASAQASATGRIILARVTGDVSLLEKATKVVTPATNNQEISQGFVVTTGKTGSVILVFNNGSTINLKPDSVLDIETYLDDPFADPVKPSTLTAEPTASTTKLNLTRGELVGNVKKLNKDKGSTFSIQTPVGAAGIRGTTFRIVYRPSGSGTAFYSLTISEGNIALATGVVTLPVGTGPAGEAREVRLDASVDATTGAVTITTPANGIVLVLAPASSQQAIAAAIQEVAQTLSNLVFNPVNSTPPPPPPATVPQPETTPGAGR